jgi:hypothetical protein
LESVLNTSALPSSGGAEKYEYAMSCRFSVTTLVVPSERSRRNQSPIGSLSSGSRLVAFE